MIYKEKSMKKVLGYITLSYGPTQICTVFFFFLIIKFVRFFLICIYYSFLLGLPNVRQLKSIK